MRHADGRWRLIQATVRDLRHDPDVGALVLFCRDVTARVPVPGADPEMLELSLTDPATGLPNRAALVRRLGAVQRSARGHRFALALVGVQGLDPAVLDAETEAAVLRTLTSQLTRALRGEDWLARGKDGDFVVLVDGTIADAEILAARLVASVRPIATEHGPLQLSAAAGVTGLSADIDPGDALRRGDLALRSARAAGPGSVHRYDDARRLQQDRRTTLRADLDGALERGELRLAFQPVVDVVMHRTVSVEALLRWRHPLFGDVSPVEFVPLAEESELITDLGRWVLREACATIAALEDSDVGVAVNVSARQIRCGELVPDVLAALESSGLPARRLIVEITESVLLDDSHVIEDLTVLRVHRRPHRRRRFRNRMVLSGLSCRDAGRRAEDGPALPGQRRARPGPPGDVPRRALARCQPEPAGDRRGRHQRRRPGTPPGHGPPLPPGLRVLAPAGGRPARRRRLADPPGRARPARGSDAPFSPAVPS